MGAVAEDREERLADLEDRVDQLEELLMECRDLLVRRVGGSPPPFLRLAR